MLSASSRQNRWSRAAVEIVDRHALLLDPGVVAEIEDALAVDVGELEHVIVGDAFQVAAEDLAGVDLVEAVADSGAPDRTARSLS